MIRERLPHPQRMLERLFLALALVSLPLAAAFANGVEIEDAWVRLPPPKTSAAAYLTIENETTSPIVIVGASSEAAERVEIHRTVEKDGVFRMVPVPSLEIGAGAEIELAPRGLHLMLIRPRALEVGEEIPITLEVEKGEPLHFEAEVRRQNGMGDGHSAHGDHSDHGSHH